MPEDQQLKVTQKVWAMTGFSLIVYGAVATYVNQNAEAKVADPMMLKVMVAISAVLFLASCVLPARIFSHQRDPSKEITLMDLTTPLKMQISMNDAIGILGLVLSFQTKDAKLCYPFLLVALIHHAYRYPASKERLISFYLRK